MILPFCLSPSLRLDTGSAGWHSGGAPALLFVTLSLFWIQAQLDDTAVRLAAQEAALRGAQQRQQLASLRAQLNALQHAPISSPATLPAKQATNSPTHDAGVAAVLLLR